jgi:hypothetical protein
MKSTVLSQLAASYLICGVIMEAFRFRSYTKVINPISVLHYWAFLVVVAKTLGQMVPGSIPNVCILAGI